MRPVSPQPLGRKETKAIWRQQVKQHDPHCLVAQMAEPSGYRVDLHVLNRLGSERGALERPGSTPKEQPIGLRLVDPIRVPVDSS